MFEVGAFFYSHRNRIDHQSPRVVPGQLLASGFNFQFPDLREALKNLYE
jgi:NAD dependent epimerase/dehydratase family enzyme